MNERVGVFDLTFEWNGSGIGIEMGSGVVEVEMWNPYIIFYFSFSPRLTLTLTQLVKNLFAQNGLKLKRNGMRVERRGSYTTFRNLWLTTSIQIQELEPRVASELKMFFFQLLSKPNI